MSNDTQYQIQLKTEIELTYEDGFADGYSRAWQECWEYFRTTFTKDEPKPHNTTNESNGEVR